MQHETLKNITFRKETLTSLAEHGVIFLSEDGVLIEDSVEIEPGTIIFPGTILMGKTKVGKNCSLGPNTILEDSTVADDVIINSSQVLTSTIGDGCRIGPFTHLRGGCELGKHVKVGNFVELKNTIIKDDASVAHLTYLGDSEIGRFVNIGCGAVTVNYDGKDKHKTIIEDGAFIGCNNSLIPPLTIGKNAYTAAGSTITEDVPDGALAIARARQVNKETGSHGRYKKSVE